jgi:hypothetical protein
MMTTTALIESPMFADLAEAELADFVQYAEATVRT